jgi:hypothetical protein
MTEQMKAATIRGLYGALWTAGSIFFVTLQMATGDRAARLEDSAIAAAAGFCAYMVSRGTAEGLIDSNRGPTPADVGQPRG